MKLLDYSGLQRFLAKIKTLLDSKANAQHTHSTSDVTDLLSDQHTWSSQQSYNADLNLNYSSTDVDDIIDTLAGSYTAEDFLAQNNVWTGSNKYSQNLNITNSGWEQGVTPASLASRYIQFLDKNNNSSGAVGFHQDNTGSSFLNILAGDKYDNGAKSTSGTLIRNQFRIGTTETGAKYQNIEGSWNCNLTPLANNTYDLGSFSNQWSNVYANEVKTTLVDPYTNTVLVVRSTDNTWDNGARMFLYSNSYLSQGYGQFYLDVDHGDNNHTKTAVTLAPNSFHPQGGTVNTTYGVSLGTPTAQWAKVYAEKYYYNGTAWGLDQTNEWTGSNKFKSSSTNFGFQSTVAEAGSLTASSNWIYWQDKNGYQDAYISRDFWNDGGDTLRISISGKRANGAPSTSGTAVECGVRLDIAANGTKSLNPFVSNDTDLGSSSLRWKNLYTSDVSTDLVESFPGGTALVIRSTDQTWENGARMFLYSNTHTGQTYGTIYTDVDHGDENHTKTGLILAPYGLYPMGGGTTGISLGSSTNRWSSVYADSYYYGTTRWGLDQINVWTNRNILDASCYTVRENSITGTTAPSSDVGRALIEVWGGDFKYWGGYGYRWRANGNSELVISNSNWNGNTQGYWEYTIGVNKAFDSLYFKPPDGISDLGTPSNRWKSVHGVTIYENGTALSSKYVPIEKLSNLNVSLNAGLGTIIYGAAYSTSITVQQTYIVQAVSLFYVRYTNLRSGSLGYAPYIKLSDTPMSYGTWEYMGSKDGAQISDTYLLGFWKRIL